MHCNNNINIYKHIDVYTMDCVANITHARKNKAKQRTAIKVNIKKGGGWLETPSDANLCHSNHRMVAVKES